MNRIFNKTTLITTLLCLVPIAIGTELQNKLPSEIPINYGFNNEAGTLASKWIVIFLLPLILALVNLFVNLTLTEKNRQRVGERLSAVLIWLVPLLSVVVSMFLILKPLGLPLKAGSLVFSIISVIFIIIGNYIPKCRPNSYIGYRLSWIMNDDELWMKTHRFSGFVLCNRRLRKPCRFIFCHWQIRVSRLLSNNNFCSAYLLTGNQEKGSAKKLDSNVVRCISAFSYIISVLDTVICCTILQ